MSNNKETIQDIVKRIKRKSEEARRRYEKRLAKMTPEQRKVELELQKQWAKEDEIRRKQLRELDEKLNEKQKELRSRLEEFLGLCHWKESLRSFKTEEGMDNYARESNKEMVPKMKELLDLANNDINRIKEVLIEDEWVNFKRRYSLYSKNKKGVLFIRGRIK